MRLYQCTDLRKKNLFHIYTKTSECDINMSHIWTFPLPSCCLFNLAPSVSRRHPSAHSLQPWVPTVSSPPPVPVFPRCMLRREVKTSPKPQQQRSLKATLVWQASASLKSQHTWLNQFNYPPRAQLLNKVLLMEQVSLRGCLPKFESIE